MKKFLGHLLLHLLLLIGVLGSIGCYTYAKMMRAHQNIELEQLTNEGPPSDAFYDAYWWWKQARLFGLTKHHVYFTSADHAFCDAFDAVVYDTIRSQLNDYLFKHASPTPEYWYRFMDSSEVETTVHLDPDLTIHLNMIRLNASITNGDLSLLKIGHLIVPQFDAYFPDHSNIKDFYYEWERFITLRTEEEDYFCASHHGSDKRIRLYRHDFFDLPRFWQKNQQ